MSPTPSCSIHLPQQPWPVWLGSLTQLPPLQPWMELPWEWPCSPTCLHSNTCVSHSCKGPDKSGSSSSFHLDSCSTGIYCARGSEQQDRGKKTSVLICRLCVHWYQKHPGGISITSLPTWAKSSSVWHPVLRAKPLLSPLIMYLNTHLFVFLASLASVWHFFLHFPRSTAQHRARAWPKTDSSDNLCWATSSVLGKKEPTFSARVVPDN